MMPGGQKTNCPETAIFQALVRRFTEAVNAQELKIAQLEARIAKLKRMQFGRSSEKIARDIEQLELELDELLEDLPSGPRNAPRPCKICSTSPVANRCRPICPAGKRCMSRPAPAPAVGARCASSAMT
jgi:hypothetical protein